MKGKKILIVDDEEDIVEMLSYNFSKQGMHVYKALNGFDAIEIAIKYIPNIILLDVMLPDIDGIEVCDRLRQNPNLKDTLVVFLSARGEDYSLVAGYNAGGDDYVVKPVKPKILIHKVRVLINRYSCEEKRHESDLIINQDRFSIMKNGEETVIPKKEFELLSLLMSVPGKVFRRGEILEVVWGEGYMGDRTLDVHIRKLREKIGVDYFKTVKGVGYCFNE